MKIEESAGKNILFVHYGRPQNEDPYKFEKPIDVLMKFLEMNKHNVQRISAMPSESEIQNIDAVVFVSIGFKEDADKISKNTGKKVFIVENFVKEDTGKSCVIYIRRGMDLCSAARKIEALI